jgi:hypothetical protein
VFTEKIAVTLADIARKDSGSKVKLYAAVNTGPALYVRLNKVIPMPAPQLSGDNQYLRMMYTSFRWFIDVHGDK